MTVTESDTRSPFELTRSPCSPKALAAISHCRFAVILRSRSGLPKKLLHGAIPRSWCGVHEIGMQIIWVAHTWPLFAMCAICQARIHRKIGDVCATRGVRLCSQFVDTTLA